MAFITGRRGAAGLVIPMEFQQHTGDFPGVERVHCRTGPKRPDVYAKGGCRLRHHPVLGQKPVGVSAHAVHLPHRPRRSPGSPFRMRRSECYTEVRSSQLQEGIRRWTQTKV